MTDAEWVALAASVSWFSAGMMTATAIFNRMLSQAKFDADRWKVEAEREHARAERYADRLWPEEP